MLPALLTALSLALPQEAEASASTPYDLVLELELTADAETIDGLGPALTVGYGIEFSGTLHIWTRSDLDLVLRVQDLGGNTLARDDDSGGSTTPYIKLGVDKGNFIDVLVASKSAADLGALELRLIAAPETNATRAAAAATRKAWSEASRLARNGDRTGARLLVAQAIAQVAATDGVASSQALHDALREITQPAYSQMTLAGDKRDAWSQLTKYRERTLPRSHPATLSARTSLAKSMHAMGDLAGARALRESLLAARERSLPADHPDLLLARRNLASSMDAMGDLAGARALRESVLAARERILPEDHPDLLAARGNLASSMCDMGDLAGARALKESVLAAYERILPEDHPDLLAVRGNLAISMSAMGDLPGARALRESVLAAYERSLPEDHPDLLAARGNLAISMSAMGDLAGARALRESLLAAYERILPEGHPDLLAARANLASSMRDMGDLAGARALFESVLAAYERILPEDHPDLLAARGNLASSTRDMGNLAGARALRESVLAAYERSLPADHPDLLAARANLAGSMGAMGDLAGARALCESVLAAYERSLPADHPDLLRARGNLAAFMSAMGELPGGRALFESVLAAYERILPEDHPDLLLARADLAVSMNAMGDLDAARALLPAQLGGMRTRILASLALAPRQARQAVASEGYRHSEVLFLSESAGSELEQGAFELTETMRLVAAEAARSLARFETDPELAPILLEAAEVRRALNDLVAGGAREEAKPGELSAELTRLSLRRDRLERDASLRLAARGVITNPVDLGALTAALGPGDVAIGYRRMSIKHVDEVSGETLEAADHLLAHVLSSDGTLNRIDLGPAPELEEIASEWRAALGAPLLRGLGLEDEEDDPEARAGSELRARILDPVLEVAGEDTTRLFICADDLLFLLPLDALPFERGDTDNVERIGDRLRIVNEVSFARLLAPAPGGDAAPSLLVLGGVDYDAQGAAPEGSAASAAPIETDDTPEVGSPARKGDDGGSRSSEGSSAEGAGERGTTRSAFPERFRKLRQARYEAEATADIFEEAFEIEGRLLLGKDTTKAALFEAAAGKRYLHLATHGWFAPESVRSTEDARPEGQGFARMGARDRVTGLAPMTLCGLALAGANKGRDSLGRVPGILTAEELCSLDLSQCELAVLSACETNVGIRRAGQGIQSLQSALYAAGARTSITSLWKVDDAATRRLMEAFYDNLWIQGMGKAEALWQAKLTLRDEGDPPAHWAGWVLTGDPE